MSIKAGLNCVRFTSVIWRKLCPVCHRRNVVRTADRILTRNVSQNYGSNLLQVKLPCGKFVYEKYGFSVMDMNRTVSTYNNNDNSNNINISSEVITFINSQDDLDQFLQELEDLLCRSNDLRKVWGPGSQENLRSLCHLLLEKNCECMNIYSFFKDNPNVIRTKQDLLFYNIRYLHDLGLRSNHLLYVLNKRPGLWKLTNEKIQGRVQQLWNLGLGDGQLKKALLAFPEILSTKKRRFQSVVELLRRLQFTSKDICQIIVETPQVFDEDEYQTELKLQYVLFVMGVTDYKDILKAKIFSYSHDHIRLRHLVLERLGLYQVPDKHGRTRNRNPSLCRIVDSTEKRFASSCAGVSVEELAAFSESLREETLEKEDEDEEEEELSDEDGDDDYSDDEHVEGQDDIRKR